MLVKRKDEGGPLLTAVTAHVSQEWLSLLAALTRGKQNECPRLINISSQISSSSKSDHHGSATHCFGNSHDNDNVDSKAGGGGRMISLTLAPSFPAVPSAPFSPMPPWGNTEQLLSWGCLFPTFAWRAHEHRVVSYAWSWIILSSEQCLALYILSTDIY